MGVTAENVAEQYQITREEQDAFALDSQMKAKAASEKAEKIQGGNSSDQYSAEKRR